MAAFLLWRTTVWRHAVPFLLDLDSRVLDVQSLSEPRMNSGNSLVVPGARNEVDMQGYGRPLTGHRPYVHVMHADEPRHMTYQLRFHT